MKSAASSAVVNDQNEQKVAVDLRQCTRADGGRLAHDIRTRGSLMRELLYAVFTNCMLEHRLYGAAVVRWNSNGTRSTY